VALEHDQYTLDGGVRLELLGVKRKRRAEKQAGSQGGDGLHKIAAFHDEIPSCTESLEVYHLQSTRADSR